MENETHNTPEIEKPKRVGNNKGHRLTLKQKIFTIKTMETLDPAKAAMEVYQPKNIQTARAIASENLTKPIIQNEMQRILRENSVDEALITQTVHKALTKTPKKPITWAEKHQYIKFASEMLGYTSEKTSINLNVGMVIRE